MERIIALTAPPTIGERYLVPTVLYPWKGYAARPWPVFLPKHEDGEHLNFTLDHHHVDPRFVAPSTVKRIDDAWRSHGAIGEFQGRPLSYGRGAEQLPHPAVRWRPRTCYRTDLPYYFRLEIDRLLTPAYAGQQCKRARTGWVCPHKHVPLGSFVAIRGVVTCPLHGLRVNAATGIVLAPGEQVAA